MAITGGMEATFENNHVVIMGCFCFTSMLGNSLLQIDFILLSGRHSS